MACAPTLDQPRLERTRKLMKAVLPQADVAQDRELVASLKPPDPDDRHVLALADLAPKAVLASAENARANLRKTVPSRAECVAALEVQGVVRFAAWLSRCGAQS